MPSLGKIIATGMVGLGSLGVIGGLSEGQYYFQKSEHIASQYDIREMKAIEEQTHSSGDLSNFLIYGEYQEHIAPIIERKRKIYNELVEKNKVVLEELQSYRDRVNTSRVIIAGGVTATFAGLLGIYFKKISRRN